MILRILVFLATLGVASAALKVSDRSISTSKQFIIYSEDKKLRAEVAIKAEDYKEFLLRTIQGNDEWKWTVILNIGVQPPAVRNPPPSKIGIYEADGGSLKVQVDVYDPKYVKQSGFNVDLLNAILLEMAYRKSNIRAGRGFELPPAWFTYGLLEKIRARDEGLRASLYAGLLSSGKPPAMKDFFRTRPEQLDSTSRAIFGAQAVAMLEAVLDLPDGREALRTYLANPHRYPGDIRDLLEAIPSLQNDPNILERKWVLAMAKASAGNRVNLLTYNETRKELDRILDVKALPDPKHPEVAAMSGPYALETIARSQSGKFILTQTSDALLRLSLRAHPVYKPLVDEYYRIVNELIARPKRRVDKRVALAEETRAALASRISDVKDYMDWVEATQLQVEDESLAEALKDIDEIEQTPRRNDRISLYLDAIEERGW